MEKQRVVRAMLCLVIWSGLIWFTMTAGALSPVLAEETALLPEQVLVITATRLLDVLWEVPASVKVVTHEEIESSGAATVAEALAQATVPAMSISTYGGGSLSQIRLRGAGSERVLVLLDGRPLNPLKGGGVDLSLLSTSNIERIEILSGANSAAWGPDAAGGVVNIITRKTAARPSLKLSYGSFNTRELQALVPLHLAGGNGLLTLEGAASDGFRENSDYTRTGLSGRLAWDLGEQTSVSLAVNGIFKEGGNPGSIFSPTPEDRQRDEILGLEIKGTHLFPNNSTWEGRLWADRSVLAGIDAYSGPYNHDAATVALESQWRVQVNHFRQRLVGLEVKEARMVSTSFASAPSATIWAAFWEEKATLPRLTLNLGGRFDGHSVYGAQFSPRAGAVYHLRPGFDLRLSVGRAFRAPSFMDLYAQYPEWNSSGNPNLKPEVEWSGEMGLTRRFSQGQVDLAVFYRDARDLIRWTASTRDSDVSWQPVNLARAKFWGVEVKGERRLAGPLEAALSYSWMGSRDEENGTEVPYTPPQQFKANLIWQGSRVLGQLGVRFVDRQWQWDSSSGTLVLLPAHWVADLNLQGPLGRNLGWFFQVENLLNEKYQEIYGYPMPGLSISGGITLSL